MTIDLKEIAGILGAFVTTGGAIIYGLKKNGLITFGRPVERRNNCKVCAEHGKLVDNIERVDESIKENSEKLDVVDGKVDRILGHLGKY